MLRLPSAQGFRRKCLALVTTHLSAIALVGNALARQDSVVDDDLTAPSWTSRRTKFARLREYIWLACVATWPGG